MRPLLTVRSPQAKQKEKEYYLKVVVGESDLSVDKSAKITWKRQHW